MAKKLEFFYDCSSPWTYLAFTKIEEVARRHDAELIWRPILVGGLFNTVNPSVYESRAKPVPVNIGRLRNPRRQAVWVALAGPAVNIVLSAVGFALCEFAIHVSKSYNQLLIFAALGLVNLVLAVFNLLPIPPLDGSAVIERFLPTKSLPRYYHFRQRALPFFFLFIILDFTFLHIGTNLLPDLENWWLGLLSK